MTDQEIGERVGNFLALALIALVVFWAIFVARAPDHEARMNEKTRIEVLTDGR